MTDQAKCRAPNCDFEGTQDEVDDHFVERIKIVDQDYAQMPVRPVELPADFSGRVSPLGECYHDNHQLIRLSDPDLGWATYCRDCHIVADSPVFPKCICGRGPHHERDFEGNSLHHPDCPYYSEPLSNNPEWVALLALRRRRLTDPEFRERERAEQEAERERQWREGVVIRTRDGETTVWVKGEIFDEDRITQVWGECQCEATTGPPLARYPGPRHQETCPRYRQRPFGLSTE